MEKKKIWKRRLVIFSILLVVGVISYTIFNYILTRQLERELTEIRKSGAPVSLQELAPPPVPDTENAAILYQQAFHLIQEPAKIGGKEINKVWPLKWSKKDIPIVRKIIKKIGRH